LIVSQTRSETKYIQGIKHIAYVNKDTHHDDEVFNTFESKMDTEMSSTDCVTSQAVFLIAWAVISSWPRRKISSATGSGTQTSSAKLYSKAR
jgi:hypothetical protein